MTYKVELKQTESGWYIECSDLLGCWSQGQTKDEAIERIKLAINEWHVFAAKVKAGQYVSTVEIDV